MSNQLDDPKDTMSQFKSAMAMASRFKGNVEQRQLLKTRAEALWAGWNGPKNLPLIVRAMCVVELGQDSQVDELLKELSAIGA